MDTLLPSPKHIPAQKPPARAFSILQLEQFLGRRVIPGEVLIFPYWRAGMFPPLQSYRAASPRTILSYLCALAEAPPGRRRWRKREVVASVERDGENITDVFQEERLGACESSKRHSGDEELREQLARAALGRHLGVYVAVGGRREALRTVRHLTTITSAHVPSSMLSWVVITEEGCAWAESARNYASWSDGENPYYYLCEIEQQELAMGNYPYSASAWPAYQLLFPSKVSYPDLRSSEAASRAYEWAHLANTESRDILLLRDFFLRLDDFQRRIHMSGVVDPCSGKEWEELWLAEDQVRELIRSLENVHQRDRLLLGTLCAGVFPLDALPAQMGSYLGDYAAYHVDLFRTHTVIALCDGLAVSMPEHALTLRSISAYLCWWLGNMPAAAARLAEIGQPPGKFRLARLVQRSVERNFFSPYILAP